MKCELYETTDEGQELVATLTLRDGKVLVQAEPGNDELIKSLEGDSFYANGRTITFKDDPEAWFMALPQVYDGSMLRAEMVAEKQDVDFDKILQA